MDLDELLSFMKDLAKRAGEVILAGSNAILSVDSEKAAQHKGQNPVDLVTEWDVKVENLLKTAIAEKYPESDFIGEETWATEGGKGLSGKSTFCVDPIDGTTNFVHGFPFCCVSIGFIRDKIPVIGVIYNPFLDQMYWAKTGGGAFLTHGNVSRKLPLYPPRPLNSLSAALIAVEWGSDRSQQTIASKTASFAKLAADPKQVSGGKLAHSLRSLGSAALNYAMVSAGSLDIYWCVQLVEAR